MSEPLSCSHPEVHVDTLWQENADLRAELQDWEERYTALLDTLTGLRAGEGSWQQRFGDCEATVLRMEAVVSAGQRAIAEFRGEPVDELGLAVWLTRLGRALDAVPRRAASPEVAG